MAEETREEEAQEEKIEQGQDLELEKPLDKMTAPELRQVAKEIPGMTGVHAMKKADLLDAIKEYQGIKDKEPKKKKKKVGKVKLSVKEMKDKIAQLKKEKESARQASDRKKVDVLRLRINRLKKKTRKVAQG